MRATLPGLGLVLFLLCAASFAAARTAARLDAPAGFERLDQRLCEGSAALVPTLSERGRGEVLGAFVEKGRDEAASLVLGRADEPLDLGHVPASELASAIARHLRARLDLAATVERATRAGSGRAPRWEARALTRAGSGARLVRFGFYPVPDAYFVLAASYPPEREQELAALFDASFDQFEPPFAAKRRLGGLALRLAGFAAAGVLVVLGVKLRRRRD